VVQFYDIALMQRHIAYSLKSWGIYVMDIKPDTDADAHFQEVAGRQPHL
jgi:hypothetical protein